MAEALRRLDGPGEGADLVPRLATLSDMAESLGLAEGSLGAVAMGKFLSGSG